MLPSPLLTIVVMEVLVRVTVQQVNETLGLPMVVSSPVPSHSPPSSVTLHSSPPSSVTLHSSPPSSVTLHSLPPSSVTLHSSPPLSVTLHSSSPSSVTLHSSPPSSVTLHSSPAISPSSPPSNKTSITSPHNTSSYDSASKLRERLEDISAAVLTSVNSRDYRCEPVCQKVVVPACLTECARRGLFRLFCRLICYSTELTCCSCSTVCHEPFRKCYQDCIDLDTACKDRCITLVTTCCRKDEAAKNQDNEGNSDGVSPGPLEDLQDESIQSV